MDNKSLVHLSDGQFEEIVSLVEKTRAKAAAFLNIETTMFYLPIGLYIYTALKQEGSKLYGKQILVTLQNN